MDDVTLTIENQVALITFDKQGGGVNVLSTAVMAELDRLLDEIHARSDLEALIFQSRKEGIFIAGADIKEIESIYDPGDGEKKAKAGQDIFNKIEDLSIPSVALIQGAALGGGLELALACSFRFASFHEKVRIGLPEVKLGIIPGFGGTVRLPRLIGLQKGMQMILQGKMVDGKQAFKMGLVDGVAADALLFETAMAFLEKRQFQKHIRRSKQQNLPTRFLENTALGRILVQWIAHKTVMKQTGGHYPAVIAAGDVVIRNYRAGREQALFRERKEFGRLVIGTISKNLVFLFYLTERYKKEQWTKGHAKSISKCGVLGAGVMGGGIAQLLSYRGVRVRLKDISSAAVSVGLKAAQKLFDALVRQRRLNVCEADTRMALISPTLDYTGFGHADLVIEAVLEHMDVKKKVLAELDRVIPKDAVIASNTSALSVQEMASAVKDPSRVVGMHFFNPVHKMPLVEVIQTEQSSPDAIATVVDFSRRLGKTPIVVKDSCGFLVNRLLLPFLNEAGYLAGEGVDVEHIDTMLLDFGMPMGAFWLLDEIGLDVGYKVALVLQQGFGDRMRVAPILRDIQDHKLLGRKSGEGFYVYDGKKRRLNPKLMSILPQRKREYSFQDIVNRTVVPMINEACLCLEEGVCREPADVDIGMVMGTGFPPFRGGLLRYADQLGVDTVVETLRCLQDHGDGRLFQPASLLLSMQKERKRFYS